MIMIMDSFIYSLVGLRAQVFNAIALHDLTLGYMVGPGKLNCGTE